MAVLQAEGCEKRARWTENNVQVKKEKKEKKSIVDTVAFWNSKSQPHGNSTTAGDWGSAGRSTHAARCRTYPAIRVANAGTELAFIAGAPPGTVRQYE